MNSDVMPEMFSFTGVVTTSKEQFGMVRDDVFFDKSVVKGPFPQVGDFVLVQATEVPGMPFKYVAKRLQCLYQCGDTENSEIEYKSKSCDHTGENITNILKSKDDVSFLVSSHKSNHSNENFLPLKVHADKTLFTLMGEYEAFEACLNSSDKDLNAIDNEYNSMSNFKSKFSVKGSPLVGALDICENNSVENRMKLTKNQTSLTNHSNYFNRPNDEIYSYANNSEEPPDSEELNPKIKRLQENSPSASRGQDNSGNTIEHDSNKRKIDYSQSYYRNILRNACSHMQSEPREQLLSKIHLFTSLHIFVESLARKKDVHFDEILCNDQICTLMLNPPTSAEKVRVRYPSTASWEPFSVEALLWELHRSHSPTIITLSSDSEDNLESSADENLEAEDSWKSLRTNSPEPDQDDNMDNEELSDERTLPRSPSNEDSALNSEEYSQECWHSNSSSAAELLITPTAPPPQALTSREPTQSKRIDSNRFSTKKDIKTDKYKTDIQLIRAKRRKRLRDNQKQRKMEAIILGTEIPKFRRSRGVKHFARSLARAQAHYARRGFTFTSSPQSEPQASKLLM